MRYLFQPFDYIMTWIRGGQGKKEARKGEKTPQCNGQNDCGESKRSRQKEKVEVDVGDQKLVAKKSPCGLKVHPLVSAAFAQTTTEGEKTQEGEGRDGKATNRLWWDNRGGTLGGIISRENYRLIHG